MPDSSKVNYKTIDGKKYTMSKMRSMSNIEQLDLVYKYYKKFKGKIDSFEKLYLITFYPAAIGKPDNYIIGSEVSAQRAKKIGEQNK